MTDELLQAIGAAPDDDAPRLVWADREGGERGELVVIQCALARHDLARAERKRLAAREAELLEEHGQAWAGFPGATFRRGFVERIAISLAALLEHVEPLFTRWPTLHELAIRDLGEPANRFIGPRPNEAWEAAERDLRSLFGRLPDDRVTSLGLSAHVRDAGDWSAPDNFAYFDDRLLALLVAAPSLAQLTTLSLDHSALTVRHVRALSQLNLERLCLGSHRLGGEGCAALLRECPSIVRLSLRGGRPPLTGDDLAALVEGPGISRLRELDLGGNELSDADLVRIGASWGLRHLERLGIGHAQVKNADALHTLGASRHLKQLRELDLTGVKAGLAALDDPSFADSLRVVRLPTNTTDLDMFPRLTALERIDRSD